MTGAIAQNKSTEQMTTSSEVIEHLRKDGYVTDFNLLTHGLGCANVPGPIGPHDFKIEKSYRFEGESNPSDSAVIYAISVPKLNIKGILVNGYGIYSDPLTAQMAQAFSLAART